MVEQWTPPPAPVTVPRGTLERNVKVRHVGPIAPARILLLPQFISTLSSHKSLSRSTSLKVFELEQTSL